jgi:hypothetical protein
MDIYKIVDEYVEDLEKAKQVPDKKKQVGRQATVQTQKVQTENAQTKQTNWSSSIQLHTTSVQEIEEEKYIPPTEDKGENSNNNAVNAVERYSEPKFLNTGKLKKNYQFANVNVWNDSKYEWDVRVQVAMRGIFSIQKFRNNQKAIINCVMSGNDVLAIMPTGGGKSLTF